MKSLLPIFLVTSTVIAAASPISVSGKWKLHQTIADNESDQTCTFTQKETELTGTCRNERGTVNITGKVNDKNVTWVYKSEYNGGPITLTYAGTLDPSAKITGTVNVAEYNVDGDFTATPMK